MAEKSGKSSVMKNCVISLTTAVERREHITQEFGKQGIAFEFFDAVTPNKINELSAKFGILLSDNQRLSLGEKACFLSHVSLWQKMLDENIDYMAIFEDDVYLGENARLFLTDDDWLKNLEFDLIKLETWQELVHIDTHHGLSVHHRQLAPLKSTHVGAAAYIIHKKSIIPILNFIQHLSESQRFAIDHVIFGALLNQLTVFQLVPALSIQANRLQKNTLQSQLESERSTNTFVYHSNDSFLEKVIKFYRRLYRSIGKRTFFQQIPFE